jgi:hypothetical protein
MFKKNCVRTPSTAAHKKMSPICEVMKGQMINSPEDTPMPIETTPGPNTFLSGNASGRSS